MAPNRPPKSPNGPPPFESYRPANERTAPPENFPHDPNRPQNAPAPPTPQQLAQWGPYAQHYQTSTHDPYQQGPSQQHPQTPYPPQHMPPQQRAPQHGHQAGMPQQQRRAGPPGGGPPGGRRPPSKGAPRGRGLLGKIMFAVLAIAVMLGGAAAYLVFNAPADLVRDRIVAEVKSATGRDLKIAGPASFTVYPNIGVSMQNVSLSPPPGMTGQPLVTMESFDVSVRILPLLNREVYVERIVLKKPVFQLYADASGRKSWEFAGFKQPALVQVAQAPGTATDAPAALPVTEDKAQAKLGGLQQLHFGNVRLEDGTIHYTDAKSGAKHDLSAINMKVALSDLRQPMSADGDLVWQGQRVALDANLTTLHSILNDKPARLVASVDSAPLKGSFDGSVTVRESFDLTGKIDVNSKSVRSLAKWLGAELPKARGYGPMTATGQLRATPAVINLADANIGLDGATAKGQVTVETQGERPYVKTTLVVSELNLNKYMAGGAAYLKDADIAASQSSAPESDAGTAKTAAPEAGPSAAKSIEDLLNDDAAKPGAKVKGYTERKGWSTEPIDFSAFGSVDADAKLTIGKLKYQDIVVGQSQATVALKNRALKTTFDDIQLYGGRGRGFITLDASAPKSAATGANLSFDGIDALPLLKDAAGFDKISGKGKLSLAVAGQGSSQQQLINSLNGKGDFTFANGAINGLNVAGMVRGISQGKLSGLKASPEEKTDFSELASSWTITNGIASNQDLRLVSPLLRLTGAGNVMLGDRQVDYVARPKLVSSLQGQGGAGTEQGIEVPVRVHGSWDKVAYTPDLKGILSDPNKALDTIKQIGSQLKGKNAGDVVKDLLGKSKDTPAQTGSTGTGSAPAQKPSKAEDLLNKLLNPQ